MKKELTSATTSGQDVAEHFVAIHEMITIRKGGGICGEGAERVSL